jgi:hypothetical protein
MFASDHVRVCWVSGVCVERVGRVSVRETLGWASLYEVGLARWRFMMGWDGSWCRRGLDGGSCPGGKSAHRCGNEHEPSIT